MTLEVNSGPGAAKDRALDYVKVKMLTREFAGPERLAARLAVRAHLPGTMRALGLAGDETWF